MTEKEDKIVECQNYIYSLLKKHIVSIKGTLLEVEEGPEEYISKCDVADGVCAILNELGQSGVTINEVESE